MSEEFAFLPLREPEGPSLFHGDRDADVGFEEEEEEEVGCCGKRRALKSEMKESESDESPRKSYNSGQPVLKSEGKLGKKSNIL